MTRGTGDGTPQERLSRPVAAVLSAVAFFAIYMATASVLSPLFEPASPEVFMEFENGNAYYNYQMMAATLGIVISGFTTPLIWGRLRGGSAPETARRFIADGVKQLVGWGIWMVGGVFILWVVSMGGFVKYVGLSLLALYGMASFAFIQAYTDKHTPPYSEGKDAC